MLQERHVRIIWASWHVLTVLGWLVAAILLWLSTASRQGGDHDFLVQAIVVAMLMSSALVLVGTKGKHPGWIGLLGVAMLAWLARSA